jgi:hypothetical protein
MHLFHRTAAENAASILREGFMDATGYYGTSDEAGKPMLWTGVWLSSVSLDPNDGANGDTVLEVTLDAVAAGILDDFEWIEEGKSYREWLIPATALKLMMPGIRIVDE